MGYFDGLTDASFKKDAAGRTLFYPWGIRGSGFIIESEEQLENIRKLYKKMYMILLPAIIVTTLTVGFLLNISLLSVYVVLYYLTARRLTKIMTRTGERLTFAESIENSAKSHNLPTLIFLEIGSLGFVAIGIAMIIADRKSLIAYSAVGFFGLCSFVITRMLIAKLKRK